MALKQRLTHACFSIAFIGLIIVAWDALVKAEAIPAVFLPSPADTFNSLAQGLSSGELLEKLEATAKRMGYGWLLASCAGIFLGALIGVSKTAQTYLTASLEALRPLPASATIPVFTALLGLNEMMVLCVIGFGALWPLLLATLHGFRKVEPRLYEVAAALGISKLEFIFKIALPSALPDIMAGARISLTGSLALAVAGEMLAGVDGLGQAILTAGRLYLASDVFAGMLLLSIVGLLAALALTLVDRWLLRWKYLQR